MKRFFALAAVAAVSSVSAMAQEDSIKMQHLNDVVVMGTRANSNAPFAVTNVNSKQLNGFSKSGQELPFLFARTPGILAWSENGTGIGTTYMRIRGAADSRINVTIDGVPLNSPEDQCVFWANMNSYAALLGSAQVQRGIGTSQNGDGAFGGTVALMTKTPRETGAAEVTASYGSFNTLHLGANFSTGLLWNHLIFDGAYNETSTDGFMHGTSGRSGSYYGGLTWYNNSRSLILRYKNIGNFEKTGQAWNGVDTGELLDGTYGAKTGIFGYEDMYDKGLGKYNSLYEYLTGDVDANGNYVTERYKLADGTLWDKTTDNFWQNHNILSAAYQIDEKWSATASLHYTYGYGYYKEFRFDNKLKKFGLPNFTLADGTKLKKTDFIRKKGLSQNAGGLIWSVNYKDDAWDVVSGMSLQMFSGNHFGYLTYMKNDELKKKYMANGDYKYYDSDATKNDHSAFVKGTYHITSAWDAFADLQYRYVTYRTNGINDKFYENEDGTFSNQVLEISKEYSFFNPKAGVAYHKDGHQAYASIAVGHREPERNNFTDNGSYPAPKAEKLFDYEVGYAYANAKWNVSANLYYMDYKNQFVQTGALSDIGEALTTNINKSYRMGAEIAAGYNVLPCLSVEANAALSQNKIKDFTEVAEDWDAESGVRNIAYDESTLAFSPSAIVNGFIDFHHKGFQATWHTNFVSRQYLDNTENETRSLPSFSQSNVSVSYTLNLDRKFMGLKQVVFGCNANNVFNKHYASCGWVYSAICESYGHSNDNRYTEIGYIPMAGFNVLGNITLRF